MLRSTAASVVFTLLVCTCVHADTYLVDPRATADFETLPQAFAVADGGDTVLLAPGVHDARGGESGWPLYIEADTPWVVGQAGADETILLGDGESWAFVVTGVTGGRARFKGITFRSIGELLHHSDIQIGCNLQFIDCVIEDCGSAYAIDASWCHSSSAHITGCIIRNNSGRGIFVYHFSGVIEDCEIAYNGGAAIGGACCEEPIIRNNFIHHNAGSGVRCKWSYLVEDNVISDNAGAGVIIESSSNIVGNIITGNNVGISQHGFGWSITGNAIFNNATYDFVLHDYSSPMDNDLTMNWWGTTVESEIRDAIWDCEDDPAIEACAIIDPWCMNPDCDVTPVHSSSWGGLKALFRE